MSRHRRALRWLGLVVCIIGPVSAQAAVPQLIRYQGVLVDTQQAPLEGPYTLTFRLYEAATGGTKVWEETQTNVPLSKGQFSVLLGQVTPLELAFDKDLWLSVEVNHDGEMTPRQQLSSVPYAYRSAVAETAQVALTAQNMKTTAIEDDGYRFVPSGVIVMVAGASCPNGYTRFASMDGKFLVAGATYNPTAGGSDTQSGTTSSESAHTHGGSSHSHTLRSVGIFSGVTYNSQAPVGNPDNASGMRAPGAGPGSGTWIGRDSTTDTQSGTTGTGSPHSHAFSFDNRPAFSTVLLCQKN